jgi:hypothetical protein
MGKGPQNLASRDPTKSPIFFEAAKMAKMAKAANGVLLAFSSNASTSGRATDNLRQMDAGCGRAAASAAERRGPRSHAERGNERKILPPFVIFTVELIGQKPVGERLAEHITSPPRAYGLSNFSISKRSERIGLNHER